MTRTSPSGKFRKAPEQIRKDANLEAVYAGRDLLAEIAALQAEVKRLILRLLHDGR